MGCYNCGCTKMWRLKALSTGEPGEWICGVCHPPYPGAADKIEWREER